MVPANQIFPMCLFIVLYSLSYKSFLCSSSLCTSPNGDCLLHEVLIKCVYITKNCFSLIILLTTLRGVKENLFQIRFPQMRNLRPQEMKWLVLIADSQGWEACLARGPPTVPCHYGSANMKDVSKCLVSTHSTPKAVLNEVFPHSLSFNPHNSWRRPVMWLSHSREEGATSESWG